jgi:hypothetical protein
MVIGNSLHPAPRRKLENANEAWIALWSFTEKLRLKATDPVISLFNFWLEFMEVLNLTWKT